MNSEQRVIDFYVLTNKLKNVIRTGWLNWHVSSQRVESVAEHVYGVQMLALAMYSEYKYDIDSFWIEHILPNAKVEANTEEWGDVYLFQIAENSGEAMVEPWTGMIIAE